MESEELVGRYPHLYHMAEDGSWPLIQRLGLLSTEALLDAFEINDERRLSILASRRPASIVIRSDLHGEAVVRDQIPLRESTLNKVLEDGLTPTDWYRLLNSFVFFWPTEERLQTLLSAKAYRDRAHTVLVVDTERLLAHHGDCLFLSPINSGSTLFDARPRGLATFRAMSDYPYDAMRRRRGPAGAIAEVAIQGGVRPIQPPLESVTRRKGEAVLEELWSA
jgi:hypothetical protein